MNMENTAERKRIYGMISINRGEFVDVGLESFNDAVEEIRDSQGMLTLQERVEIAKRGFCNIVGSDYMIAFNFLDEETEEIEDQELEGEF